MTYDWRDDAIGSWRLWCRMMALGGGFIRPASLPEMYFAESRGVIP